MYSYDKLSKGFHSVNYKFIMNLLQAMSVFVKIVDSGNLSSASVELDISPTMVGKHLRMLESHLNSTLINRTTRRISLTQAGKSYYIHCREVLALIEEGEKEFKKTIPSRQKNHNISPRCAWEKYHLTHDIGVYGR